MPPTDPIDTFDDFVLYNIFSFLPPKDVVWTGYNVSKAWRDFYARSRLLKPNYLALNNVNEVQKVDMLRRDADSVDWRTPCMSTARALLTLRS